jgi:hypothetical protein
MDAAPLMAWGRAEIWVAVFAAGEHASCLRGAAHGGFWHLAGFGMRIWAWEQPNVEGGAMDA